MHDWIEIQNCPTPTAKRTIILILIAWIPIRGEVKCYGQNPQTSNWPRPKREAWICQLNYFWTLESALSSTDGRRNIHQTRRPSTRASAVHPLLSSFQVSSSLFGLNINTVTEGARVKCPVVALNVENGFHAQPSLHIVFTVFELGKVYILSIFAFCIVKIVKFGLGWGGGCFATAKYEFILTFKIDRVTVSPFISEFLFRDLSCIAAASRSLFFFTQNHFLTMFSGIFIAFPLSRVSGQMRDQQKKFLKEKVFLLSFSSPASPSSKSSTSHISISQKRQRRRLPAFLWGNRFGHFDPLISRI